MEEKKRRGRPKKIDYSRPVKPGQARIAEKYRQWFKEHHQIHGDIKTVRIDDKNIAYRFDHDSYSKNNEV